MIVDPSAGQPIIDNVAVHAKPVPEPATALGLVAGVIGLWVMGRRRA